MPSSCRGLCGADSGRKPTLQQPADRKNALFLSFMRAMDCPPEGSPGSCPVSFFFSFSLSVFLLLRLWALGGTTTAPGHCPAPRLACPIQGPEARCTRTLGQKGGRGKALRTQVLPDPPIPTQSGSPTPASPPQHIASYESPCI